MFLSFIFIYKTLFHFWGYASADLADCLFSSYSFWQGWRQSFLLILFLFSAYNSLSRLAWYENYWFRASQNDQLIQNILFYFLSQSANVYSPETVFHSVYNVCRRNLTQVSVFFKKILYIYIVSCVCVGHSSAKFIMLHGHTVGSKRTVKPCGTISAFSMSSMDVQCIWKSSKFF